MKLKFVALFFGYIVRSDFHTTKYSGGHESFMKIILKKSLFLFLI